MFTASHTYTHAVALRFDQGSIWLLERWKRVASLWSWFSLSLSHNLRDRHNETERDRQRENITRLLLLNSGIKNARYEVENTVKNLL